LDKHNRVHKKEDKKQVNKNPQHKPEKGTVEKAKSK